jgi:hypothetical protein
MKKLDLYRFLILYPKKKRDIVVGFAVLPQALDVDENDKCMYMHNEFKLLYHKQGYNHDHTPQNASLVYDANSTLTTTNE